MSLISWLKEKLGGKPVPLSGVNEFVEEYEQYYGNVYFREIALWSAITLISKAISKCEFKTYLRGTETKKEEYYLWNYEPNKNQNSSVFLHKLISRLIHKNECLVIEHNGQLLIADDYERTKYALYDDVFKQVTVNDFTFNKTFVQSDVLFFQLHETNVKKIIDGLYESYANLISYTMTSYKRSRGTKGIFKYDSIPIAGTPEREAFDNLINGRISSWLKNDNAALPLGNGLEWKENQNKSYTPETTRDIRAMIDDICDFTARALGIPPSLLKGDVQDTSKAIDQFLTFCIDPLVDMIQEEIIRKRIGKTEFLKGTKLVIDTKAIKHIDLMSVATSIDKLISSGCFCINDIRKVCGEEPIDEPWANQYFMTKNYATVEELLKSLEGGAI